MVCHELTLLIEMTFIHADRMVLGEGEVGGRLSGDWIQYGYDQAAGLTLGLLRKRIDDLHEKIRSGGKLTQQEQYLLTILSDITAEIERELQYNWETYLRP